MSKGPVRRIRLRAAVAYPSVTVALVAVVALALTSFGSSQVTALAATTDPTAAATTDPTPAPTTDPPATTAADPAPTTAPSTIASPPPGLGVSPGAAFGDHHVLARIPGPALPASYLAIDATVPNASQFQTFRVRFRLHNASAAPITTAPQLEYRAEGSNAYVLVPEKPAPRIPLHLDREWVPSLGLGGGTMQGPLGEDIAVGNLLIGKEGGLAVNGHHSMGANPDRPITLPSDSYTEEEFTVTLSMDAQYLTGYELRITDSGTPLTGTDVATIRLGAPPAVRLSPGQRQGVAVADPKATTTAAVAYPLLTAPVKSASAAPVTAVPAAYSTNTQSYPLVASTPSAAIVPPEGIHGPYSLTTDKCAVCHRAHAAKAPNLLAKGSQSALCFSCHDGTAANADVKSQYSDALVPLNKPAAREYYSHDAVAPSNHTRADLDEFGGVSNRHSECADCHNSHKAGTTDSTQTATGWSASGRLAGVSGVSVVNNAAGEAPSYTFRDGVQDPVTGEFPVTREYELCFKCHSGATILTSNANLKPSQYALDKGVEFNPANASFHPVEAAGKNNTDAMKASLAGTSTYKLWNFNVGSTIRCLNCHAGGATDATTTPPLLLPGSALAPHTSSNRGILLENYKDRVLKSATDAYSAGDFALCYVCHAEEPFAPDGTSSGATNFSLHSRHLTGLAEKGSGGTDIDKAGDGQGNAICAECHFRIHSTTDKVPQTVNGSRLVNFAPNVQPAGLGGTISWTPGATSSGSCTLTCHDHTHTSAPY